MPMLIPEVPNRSAPRPHHRLVVPDPPEPWTLDDVDFLLWPNSPEHLPSGLQEQEEGRFDGIAMGAGRRIFSDYPTNTRGVALPWML